MQRSLRRHLCISVRKVRRHKGDSFPRQIAYICRTTAFNPRTGRRYNFERKGPVEAVGLEGWGGSVEDLIAEAVFSEKRKKKVVEGRVVILAIPHELGRAERLRLVRKCAAYLVRKFKAAVCYGIHPPPEGADQRQWHAHILMTSRRVDSDLKLGLKTRELDSLKLGGQNIEAIRSSFCNAMNAALRQAGHEANIEHRSYRRLGEEREPGRHKNERQTCADRGRLRNRRPLPIPGLRPLAEPKIDAPAPRAPSTPTAVTGPLPAAGNKTGQPIPPPEPLHGGVRTPQVPVAVIAAAPEKPAEQEPPPKVRVRPPLADPAAPARSIGPEQ